MIDRARVLASVDVVTVVRQFFELKQEGRDWVCSCPFHDEKSPSFKISAQKQIYKCFGCGATGDAISFLMEYKKIPFLEAVKELTPSLLEAAKPKEVKQPENIWKQVFPIPSTAPAPNFMHFRHGSPSRIWAYKTETGEGYGYICRFDVNGKKEILPLIYATSNGQYAWKWQGFDKPRKLYNLDQIAARPYDHVLLVEGEKSADAAIDLLPFYAVSTWVGGTNADEYVDYSPLAGRSIVLWPDNDAVGIAGMHRIANRLKALNCTINWINPPQNEVKGWDIADASWTQDEAFQYVAQNIIPLPSLDAPLEVSKPAANADDYSDSDERFIPMGWDKNENGKATYHFYSKDKKTVLTVSAGSLGVPQLLELSPITYWEANFAGAKGGINLQAAQNYLIQRSNDKGPFYPSIRGRGAWMDKGKPVIHNGSYLLVEGERVELDEIKSKHIYENAPELGFNVVKPLAVAEARKLFKIVDLLNWDRRINGALLLGWCVVAPVCGALSWRPHIWLTAPAGAGKSWVFKNIVRRLLGEGTLAAQGDSTEAGLRQTLGHDAIPVVFDEAENEDERASGRIQNVLALMRTASADDGGNLYKGSASGVAKTFKIRSCFAYASIVPQLKQQADRTRVTLLTLTKPAGHEANARFKELLQTHSDLITDEFIDALRSRTVHNLPTILKNITVFKNAATQVLGDSRGGDQIGTLLAGAYSLISDDVASHQIAIDWLEENEWVEEKGLEQTRDELALLNHITEQIVKVKTDVGLTDFSVGELIKAGSDNMRNQTYGYLIPELAEHALLKYGIKIDDSREMVMISNTHNIIKEWLKKTPWGNNHGKLLLRIDGAIHVQPMRFGTGTKTRAVGIPIDIIIDRYQPMTKEQIDAQAKLYQMPNTELPF